jgi:hypothetical protein
MSEDKQDGVFIGTFVAMILGFLCFLTYHLTVHQVHKEAVANGCGHWTIVNGETEFAWGSASDVR